MSGNYSIVYQLVMCCGFLIVGLMIHRRILCFIFTETTLELLCLIGNAPLNKALGNNAATGQPFNAAEAPGEEARQ